MSDDEKTPSALICESCGKEFSCGAGIGECWCFELKIPAENLEKLKNSFQKCLCPLCLLSCDEKIKVETNL